MGIEDIINTERYEVLSVTTGQRIALGNLLATFKKVKYILVYDINTQSIWVWNGEEWV